MLKRLEDLMLSLVGIFIYIFFLKRTCYYSPQKMKRYQYKEIKKLLLICQNKVPYYKRLFKEIGFEVNRDFKTIDDIELIPITTKKNVKTHHDDFINPDYKDKAIVCKTSGSTGEPLSVLVSKNQWAIEQGIVWRHWKWSGYRFRNGMAIIRSYAPENGKLIKLDKIRNFIYYSPYDLTDKNMDMYLNHMISKKIKFLRGYPSSLNTLAKYVIKTNHNIPKLKGIFSASEVLSETDRIIIEKAFKVKVTNWYGLAECIVAMGDCNRHEGMHLFDEYGYTELIDTDNPRIKKIIGTNLHNYAMPFLRYETNDMAICKQRDCNCNHKLPTIENILGRSNVIIKLKDREIPITNFYTLMEHYPEVLSWQIVQYNENKIELILEKQPDQTVCKELEKKFKVRLPEQVEFYISNRDFMKKGEGKKLAYIRL